MPHRSDGDPHLAVRRPLGWLIAFGGSLLLIDQTVFRLDEIGHWASWWNAPAAMVIVLVIGLVLTGRRLPGRVLRVVWWTVPLLYTLLQLSWPLAYRGADIDAVTPWTWTLEPVVITLTILVVRPVVSIAMSLGISALPALTALVLLGHVPEKVLQQTPEQLSNIVYVAVFIGLLIQLERLGGLEREAATQRRRETRAAARADRQIALSRLLHDEVLSVLSAAMQTDGEPSPTLRVAAHRAIGALDEDSLRAREERGSTSTREAAALRAGTLRRIDEDAVIETDVTDGILRDDVLTALTGAAAEALRNTVRHAGPEAIGRVHIDLAPGVARVTVSDDGVGFDVFAPRTGLGIDESIVSRLSGVGGTAEIRSAPGAGTEVTLSCPN